ncbi:MAG: hypothetical protein OEO23_11360, partial [Gemmatimonadota bacterium]|nr:hypothetical protein [Gemmatimonadota bacterium]
MTSAQSEQDPTFLVFLPILCAVWADGLLEEGELRSIHGILDEASWITEAGRAQMRHWLEVGDPPAPHEFETARALVADAVSREGFNLVRAGLALAGDRNEDGDPWATPAALSTLARLEEELGLAGQEALRALGGPVARDAALPPGAP